MASIESGHYMYVFLYGLSKKNRVLRYLLRLYNLWFFEGE